MPVEVVVGEVQPDGYPWPERGCRLELKAARFHNVGRVRRRLVDLRAQRYADVAADEDLSPGGRQHPTDERRRGGLPLGAGNRDHRSADPTPCQLELADDLDAAPPRGIEHRLLDRHPRAGHDKVGRGERLRPMSAQLQRHAGVAEPIGALERVARLGEHHRRAAAREQTSGCDPAARGADYRHPLPLDREHVASHAITGFSMSSG